MSDDDAGSDHRCHVPGGGGERLVVTLPDPTKQHERTIYGLLPSGRRVSATTFQRLRPHLVPVGDGLFGVETSQTFMLPPSAADELLKPQRPKRKRK